MPETKHESPDFFKRLETFVKRNHETLWLGTRFLPVARRRRALCLLCLDGEFYRIVTSVNEEMIGQIRLQWWRDEIERLKAGEAPQKSMAGEALGYLLKENADDAAHVLRLLDAYDDHLGKQETRYAENLFGALMDDRPRGGGSSPVSIVCGRVFQLANQKVSGEPLTDAVNELADRTSSLDDEEWAWVSLFDLLPFWLEKKNPAPIAKRWRIWRSFLAGEKRLQSRLRRWA